MERSGLATLVVAFAAGEEGGEVQAEEDAGHERVAYMGAP